MSRIALAEMVEELRRELVAAAKSGEGEELRFKLGEVVIEAEVEVTKEVEGKSRVKFWLAELGASGRASKARTQKITLKLEPNSSRGGAIHLGRSATS